MTALYTIRRRAARIGAICITLALAGSLAFVWLRVVQSLSATPDEQSQTGEPGGIVWDGRVFTSDRGLQIYLESKGLSYSRWLARHPGAFGTSSPAPINRPSQSRTKPVSGRRSKLTTSTARHALAGSHVSSGTNSHRALTLVLMIVLLLGGLAVAGSALIPARMASPAMHRIYADPDRRMIALAVALAIVLGFAVSLFLY